MGVSSAAKAEVFRFQISRAVPEHLLQAWFEQAQAGERIVYCHGYLALRDNPAWKLAGAFAREGLVDLVTERDGAQTKWIAEKRRTAPAPALAAKHAAAVRAEPLVKLQLDALLGLLRDAAAKGARCPTKTEQARAVTGQEGIRARNRVTYLRKRLEAEGKITVVAGAHNQAPVVTILARGKGCGLSTAAATKGAADDFA